MSIGTATRKFKGKILVMRIKWKTNKQINEKFENMILKRCLFDDDFSMEKLEKGQ